MEQKEIQIPTEIARFKLGYFGAEIQWLNPFDSISIFELRNHKNELIYKAFLQNKPIVIVDVEKYITESYSVEIKNIASGKIKLYSIAY